MSFAVFLCLEVFAIYYVLAIVLCLIGCGIGYFIRGVIGKKRKTSAEIQAKEIEERSQREAEARKRELYLKSGTGRDWLKIKLERCQSG